MQRLYSSEPKTIVLFGASAGRSDANSFNARITRALIEGYERGTYRDLVLINPNYPSVDGRQCHPRIPEGIRPDVGVVVVPPADLTDAVAALAESGAALAIVVTSSLTEEGKAGLRTIADHTGISILGPSSLGIESRALGVHTLPIEDSTSRVDTSAHGRGVGVISQSGGWAALLIGLLAEHGIGVSEAVATGQELFTTSCDVLEFFIDLPHLDVIFMYMEGVQDPHRFRRLARRAYGRGKRVVVLKVGRTTLGGHLAMGHTGAVVGDWDAFTAACASDGVFVASTAAEAVGLVRLLASASTVEPLGSRIAVLTNSGGSATLAADLLDGSALSLSDLDTTLKYADDGAGSDRAQYSAIRAGLDAGSPLNPFDTGLFGGTAKVIDEYLRLCVSSAGVIDVVVGSFIGGAYATLITESLKGLKSSLPRTLLVAVWPLVDGAVREELASSGIPVFDDLGEALRLLEVLRSDRQGVPDGEADLDLLRPADDGSPIEVCSYDYARRLIHDAGINLPRAELITVSNGQFGDRNHDEIVKILPAYLKACDAGVEHKAAVGGVDGPLFTTEAVDEHIGKQLARGLGPWFMVEAAADDGLDLLVSARRTPQGALVTVAWGGRLAEVLPPLVTVVEPIEHRELASMLSRNPMVGRLLAGTSQGGGLAGGGPVAELASVALKLVEGLNVHDLEQMEVNPLRLIHGEFVALDVKVWRRLSDSAAATATHENPNGSGG